MTSMGRISETAERRAAARVPLGFVPAAGDVHAILHRATEAMGGLAEEWTVLAAHASEPNVFAEHWFVAAALRTLPGSCDVRLLEVRRGRRLIGLFLFEIVRGYARLPVRVVRNWCHDHAFLGTPLVAAGEERAFWAATLDALNAAGLPANLIHLWRMAEGGPVERAFGGAIVHRRIRAFLNSSLSPAAYYEQAVRGKKRKELRRQRNRLGDLGRVEARILADRAELDGWCDAYLALEQAGWKGKEGTALACAPESEAFFREAVAGAWEAGRLQFRRLDLDGRPVAMLVNFLSSPGSFSFKTAFDEGFAAYSPGVQLQIENLDLLDRPDIDWMDSCAVQDHPMIDSLWTERRAIVRCTLPLKGVKRRALWAACRALELASARLRRGTDL
jgi:CelD/BcsL family acetyltransferase involved in cellulose biosynthesis